MPDTARRRPPFLLALVFAATAILALPAAPAGARGATAASIGASDARAAVSPWSVRVEGPLTARELGVSTASPRALARAAIEKSARELGVPGRRMGRLRAGPSFRPPGGSNARVVRFRQSVGGCGCCGASST